MEINIIISITIEIFALLIGLLISLFMVINKRRNQKDHMILWMLFLTEILLFNDVLAYSFRGNASQLGWYIVRISNFCVFMANYLMLAAYGICLRVYIKSKSKRLLWSLRAVWLMTGISVVLLIISQFSSFLYYFDADNFYHRGTMFILTQAAPVVGGIIYLWILAANRKTIQRNVWIALALYLVLPYFATLFQVFVYGYPAQTVAGVIGCWGIFFSREIEVRNQLEWALTKEKEKQEQLERALTTVEEQYSVLKSMSEVYYSMHLIDLVKDSVKELNAQNEMTAMLKQPFHAAKMMADIICFITPEKYRGDVLRFTDLNTLAERMQNRKSITGEFISKQLGWYRAEFIAIETDSCKRPTKVVFTIQDIDEEKRQRDALIYRSQTDELTGLYNRWVYEEDLTKYNEESVEDAFVYISFDVNSLKTVNDTLGHAAGYELLIGACKCMKDIFGSFGKLYRIGGDEFVFIGFSDENQLERLLLAFEEAAAAWSGKMVKSLSISYGVVSKKEQPNTSVEKIALIADQRMYSAKREYYQKKGSFIDN